MSARTPKPGPAKIVRRIIADTARDTQRCLVESRLPVDPNLREMVNRRGLATARQLTLLTDEMVRARGPQEAKAQLAAMCARLVDARLAS